MYRGGQVSLPAWERGLKFAFPAADGYLAAVAPGLGAWIEICQSQPWRAADLVAPGLGAWIEISQVSA